MIQDTFPKATQQGRSEAGDGLPAWWMGSWEAGRLGGFLFLHSFLLTFMNKKNKALLNKAARTYSSVSGGWEEGAGHESGRE